MDSRKIFEGKEIRWEQIQEGDWIKPKRWTRARRVELIEYKKGQRTLLLADPDQEDLREVNLDFFVARARTGKNQEGVDVPVWYHLPMLRTLWDSHQAA